MIRSRVIRWLEQLGPGGMSSFLLAFASGALGLGLPVAWTSREVVRRAAGDPLRKADAIVVLGRELVDDRPTDIFVARLDHARALFDAGWAEAIVVTGGVTGQARRSEASAGRDYLIGCGTPPEAITLEESSRHTLENLYNVRTSLRARGARRILLVSDPLHLARAGALARGLSLDVCCSPAASAPPPQGSLGWWMRLGREGFLLHWYRVGIAYSEAIGSEQMLARVR